MTFSRNHDRPAEILEMFSKSIISRFRWPIAPELYLREGVYEKPPVKEKKLAKDLQKRNLGNRKANSSRHLVAVPKSSICGLRIVNVEISPSSPQRQKFQRTRKPLPH